MAKIIVCYKWVKDEADVRVNADLSVDLSKAKYKISDYDKNTIEAGSRIASALGCGSVGVSCGGTETRKSFGDALARGLEEGIWINTGDEELTGVQTGRLIAAAVKTVDDAVLVLCSEGSSDEYARQTAPRVGALLDWPVITSVVDYKIDGNRVTASRKMEDSLQIVQAELPAVLAVLPEAAPAPIPGLKQVMMAKKKPVTEYTKSDLNVDTTSVITDGGLTGYVSQRKNIVVKEDTNEMTIAALLDALKKEGVI